MEAKIQYMCLMDKISVLKGMENAVERFKFGWDNFVKYWKRTNPYVNLRQQILELI